MGILSVDDIVVVDVLFVGVLFGELHDEFLGVLLGRVVHEEGGEVEELVVLD